MFILSTEANTVVNERALKLGLKSNAGVPNKMKFLHKYLNMQGLDNSRGLVFLGNDLNDLECLELAEFSFCPADAHEIVKKAVTHLCSHKGGNGFVREALEFLQSNTTIKG
jgi:3-deoxy-D-manno-octulosonate 8-phosphate phosphatase KdsC-like HAD superfamily phosphatase